MTHSNRFRWGILGLGKIAHQFIRDLRAHGHTIEAVASRNPARAEAFAQEWGIPHAYGEYAALLANPDLDGVYIALPNSLHVPWTMAAARAGKAVLCEKPFAEAPEAVQEALTQVREAGVFFMEGFMYRCHPQWARVQSLLNRGDIGEIRLMESRFSYNLGSVTENIRLRKDLLGGSLMDVGCYCVNFSQWMMQSEPAQVQALATLGKVSQVDEWMSGLLRFESGAQAVFQCGSRVQQPSWAAIYGEKGRIEIPEPWKPKPHGAEVRIFRGHEVEVFTEGDGLALFAREALAVENSWREGKKESSFMTWADSISQARTMAAIRSAAGLN
jgi:D-xylose 1-dehydrogenase (NADP+, D-xylono-1,5-lactone-forming)